MFEVKQFGPGLCTEIVLQGALFCLMRDTHKATHIGG